MSTREVHRSDRWIAAAVGAAWLGSAVFLVALALFAPAATKPWPAVLLGVVFGLVPLIIAALIARRAPGNPASALLAAAGGVLVATNSVADGAFGPFEGSWMLLYLPFAILLLVFPSRTAATPRWRVLGWTLTAVVAGFQMLVGWDWFAPSTPGVLPASFVALGLFFIGLCACAAAPFARYRTADEQARLRLRWMFLTGGTLPLTLLLCWVSYLLWNGPDLVGIGLALMYLAFPIGTAIALLRPTIIDVDRAVVVASTVLLLVVGMLVVLTVGALATGLPVVRWPPVIAITVTAVLTAIAGLCFRLVHRGIDRMLYPERARTVAALTALARDADQGRAMPEDVESVLRRALRDPEAVIGLRMLGGGPLVRLDGSPLTSAINAVPIRVRGEEIGVIATADTRPKPPAAAIARAAAPLVDAVRTRAELARAREEVESSRERLLRAGYEERRRLERDLHDGAQQRLVALGMNLRVLQRATGADTAIASSLDAAVAELATAVAELRQLAHGVRPSALDDGLLPALSDLVRQVPQVVELDAQPAELPDAVATTAYYVVSEAIVNALKHADASRVRVRVRQDDAELRVTVTDDGRGGADVRAGRGLVGLTDRVQTLGGHLQVSSTAGQGTTIEAVLPCGS